MLSGCGVVSGPCPIAGSLFPPANGPKGPVQGGGSRADRSALRFINVGTSTITSKQAPQLWALISGVCTVLIVRYPIRYPKKHHFYSNWDYTPTMPNSAKGYAVTYRSLSSKLLFFCSNQKKCLNCCML